LKWHSEAAVSAAEGSGLITTSSSGGPSTKASKNSFLTAKSVGGKEYPPTTSLRHSESSHLARRQDYPIKPLPPRFLWSIGVTMTGSYIHLKPSSGGLKSGRTHYSQRLGPPVRQLPRHGPQAQRHRNLHRGAEGADREGEGLNVLCHKRPQLCQDRQAGFGPTLQGTIQIRLAYLRSLGAVLRDEDLEAYGRAFCTLSG
jgi:hypothetical protein